MQRDPSLGRRVASDSPSEGTRFRQSRQSRPEHPGVSDGNQGCCWCTWSRFWKRNMVGHGYSGEWVGWGNVKKLGYIYQNLVYGSTHSKLPAGCAGTWYAYVLYHSDYVNCCWSKIGSSPTYSMQIIILRNDLLAGNKDWIHFVNNR